MDIELLKFGGGLWEVYAQAEADGVIPFRCETQKTRGLAESAQVSMARIQKLWQDCATHRAITDEPLVHAGGHFSPRWLGECRIIRS
jgi:hypothetical protein